MPWVPSGWMGSIDSLTLDGDHQDQPHSGRASIRMRYVGQYGWVGVAWQNPPNNWGDQDGGYDLSGATALELWARGEYGGEKISIGVGLIGNDKPYPDSAVEKVDGIVLTQDWQRLSRTAEEARSFEHQDWIRRDAVRARSACHDLPRQYSLYSLNRATRGAGPVDSRICRVAGTISVPLIGEVPAQTPLTSASAAFSAIAASGCRIVVNGGVTLPGECYVVTASNRQLARHIDAHLSGNPGSCRGHVVIGRENSSRPGFYLEQRTGTGFRPTRTNYHLRQTNFSENPRPLCLRPSL